jgi:hypothetical protein
MHNNHAIVHMINLIVIYYDCISTIEFCHIYYKDHVIKYMMD